MKRLIWSRSARAELEALNEWYAARDPELPLVFTLRIEVELAKLLDFPQLGSAVPDSTSRKWRIRSTPYLVLYRPTREGVRILKVRHQRSDWRSAS